jgi:hypothetical protein
MKLLPIRRILFPIAAFAAVGIYLIWWVTYAGIHFIPRFSLRPPGASGELAGTSIRVLSLTRAHQLTDAKGGQPGIPDPGAVWIVAELEAVRHDPTKDFFCDTRLLGPEQRLWSTASLLQVSRAMPSCKSDLVVGQPTRFESIFMVPARYADQLSGIALMDGSSAARTPVIRPAPQ